ncbi:MAG TPA: hypothetical protein VF637_04235 [Sphingomicrobium sp.]
MSCIGCVLISSVAAERYTGVVDSVAMIEAATAAISTPRISHRHFIRTRQTSLTSN